MKEDETEGFGLAPGDTAADAIEALRRAVKRTGRRAAVLRRRAERSPGDKKLEHEFLLAAQEYYYVAKLASDFKDAALDAVAQLRFDQNEKKNNLN